LRNAARVSIEFGGVLHASAGAVLHPGNRIRANKFGNSAKATAAQPEFSHYLFDF
jgi:hypothetical protein